MSDYDWIGPVAGAIGKGVSSFASSSKANQQMQDAYAEMLANLQARFGDYDKLGKAGYSDLSPNLLGPSALEGIQEDPAARQAQLAALAKLSELEASGGLSLSDMKALNEIQANLGRNDSSRRNALANSFAARGQLGAGAQLAMGLQGAQDAAMNANQRGEATAAQAQDRAMQAILEKGRMAGSMGSEDYRRKAEAARARDIIEARNAAARTDASKYNNSLRGQTFDDELSKARGKTQLTGDMNKAVFGRGSQSANTTLGQAGATNELIDSGVSAWGKFGGSSGGGDTMQHDSSHGDELSNDEDTEH